MVICILSTILNILLKKKNQKKYKSIIKVLDSFRTKYQRFAKGKNDKFTTKLDKYLEKIGHIL